MQNNENIVSTNSVLEYKTLASMFEYTETGLSITGEMNLGGCTTISTNKCISLPDEEKVVESYQKVVEMRELTTQELENVSKAKLILKKSFDVLFKGKKFNLYYFIFLAGLFGIDMAIENYLGASLMVLFSLFYISPIKFYKEVKNVLAREKRIEELQQYLIDNNLLSLYCSDHDDVEISLYLKPKITKF